MRKGRVEAHSFKFDVYRSLPRHMVTQTGKLARKDQFVDAFEQTRPQVAMDAE